MPDDAHARHDQSESDRPSFVLNRASYPEVNKAHIVPRMYQKAFAVQGRVAVHMDGNPNCVLASTKTAGTRARYYRRARPDGELIDDVEASLSVIEDKAAEPLRDLIAGEPIKVERKGILAQFIAVQMLRGPAFFEEREQLLVPMIEELEADDFTPEGLVAAGGDVEVARKRAIDKYLDPTQRLLSMLTRSVKLASVLGHMRWSVVRFDQPALAYSDHPVAMWPMNVEKTPALSTQQFGPLSALEVRIPLAPDVALLMDWVDRSDQHDISLELSAASEFNAFTVAQADREWMHRPGAEPEVAGGTLELLSRLVEPAYDRSALLRSARRATAQEFLASVQGRQFVNTVQVLTDLGPA
jgi:uncharacterized protein DUF4238